MTVRLIRTSSIVSSLPRTRATMIFMSAVILVVAKHDHAPFRRNGLEDERRDLIQGFVEAARRKQSDAHLADQAQAVRCGTRTAP